MQADNIKTAATADKSVLFIGFVWPELRATAASQNIVGYIRAFTESGYAVHFASAAQHTPLSSNLRDEQVVSHVTKLNDDSFDELVADIKPDIVVFDRFLSEEQFGWRVMKAAPDALRVLDCEDLHFLRHARHALYKSEGYTPSSARYLDPMAVLNKENTPLLESDMCLREMACIYRSDLVLVLSDFEKTLLHERFDVPEDKVLLTPYLPDTKNEHKTPLADLNNVPFQARRHFVSIGNFRHAPNIDAVNVVVQHLWPAIRKALPQAECHIYGAYMPPRIKERERPALGLYMHGYIEDHFAALQTSKVLLAPLQFGAGVKGKFIDAFRCGLPSITTPIGAEGIAYENWPGAIVFDQDAFIKSAIELYQAREDKYVAHQKAMHDILNTQFNTSDNQGLFMKKIEQALTFLDALRQSDFMQKLISHHSLQTHQYMSQWIAEKNRDK